MRLTASAITRGEACLGSLLLEGFAEGGAWASAGNVADRYVQTAKTKDKATALAEAPEEMRAFLGELALEKIPDGAEYQVAFALDAQTGEVRRIPGRAAGYPDDMGPEWIFGTSDIVGVRDGRGLVWDLKLGIATIGRDPAEDAQLGFYAVCVAAVAGVTEVEVGFARAGWDGVLRPETAILDEMALDSMRHRIVGLWRRTRGNGEVKLNVGDHCTYCPARRSCPAMVQPVEMALRSEFMELAVEELPALDAVRAKVTALAPDDKGRLYERLDAAADFLALVKGVLRDDARTAAIPLSGGRELREVQWGSSQKSPLAKERLRALTEELEAAGEIKTIKVAQVRPMRAAR